MEDSFNAAGRARGRKRKEIALVSKKAAEGADAEGADSIPSEMAKAARHGRISRQAKEAWSGVDGFDNADGKKMTSTQKIFAIGIASFVIFGGILFAISKFGGKKGGK